MRRAELETYLDQYLDTGRFRDYCPNGLQVEGRATVNALVSGVTASLELIEQAIAAGADAMLVHHGYFWRGEDARITGVRRRRIALLMTHDISLFAYHLPLDAHPEVGNNIALARMLDFSVAGRFGDQDLGFHGEATGSCAWMPSCNGSVNACRVTRSSSAIRRGRCSASPGARGRRRAISRTPCGWASTFTSAVKLGTDRAPRARERRRFHRCGSSRHRALRSAGTRRAPCSSLRESHSSSMYRIRSEPFEKRA